MTVYNNSSYCIRIHYTASMYIKPMGKGLNNFFVIIELCGYINQYVVWKGYYTYCMGNLFSKCDKDS